MPGRRCCAGLLQVPFGEWASQRTRSVILRLMLLQRCSGWMFTVCSADGASTAGACCSPPHGMGSSDFVRGREAVGSTRPSTETCSTVPACWYVQHETCSQNSKPSRLLVHGRNRVAPERSRQPPAHTWRPVCSRLSRRFASQVQRPAGYTTRDSWPVATRSRRDRSRCRRRRGTPQRRRP
jgi:hypothetical protein